MTPPEKIHSHATLKELSATIEADKITRAELAKRYPVRFILLEDFSMLQVLAEEMRKADVTLVDLEELRGNDTDTWITHNELANTIRNKESPSRFVMVSPVSEVIRFYDREEFRTFLNEVATLEKQDISPNVSRIYIPLVGLRNRFEDFLTHFYRIKESAPIWAVREGGLENATPIFLLPDNTEKTHFGLPEGFEYLTSFYEWLRFWKTNAPKDRVFISSLVLNAFYQNAQPDNVFQIIKIENAYNFLTKVLDIHFVFEYVADEDVYWQRLLCENDWRVNKDFNQFIRRKFNVQKVFDTEIIRNWLDEQTDDFGRWLLKKVALATFDKGSYLFRIFSGDIDLRSGAALLGKVANEIIEESITDVALKERRLALEKFPSAKLSLSQADEAKLIEFIDKVSDSNFEHALLLCTGRFCFEHERFIAWHKTGKLSLERLKGLYSEMADYLSSFGECAGGYEEIESYFQAYKMAKLRDEYTNEIKGAIEKLNISQESFWQWHSQYKGAHDLLAEEGDAIDKIYWLDGVGAEWLPCMLARIRKSRFEVEKVAIAAAKIPSTTENNRFDGKNIIKKEAMDKFAHEAFYRYPHSICKELQIIRELMDEILSHSSYKKIAIVSDHGLCALSRLLDGRNYTKKSTHEGREEEVLFAGIPDGDYIFAKANGKHYRVALKHASLGAKPVREVHGGCTPEEVLVPLIVLKSESEPVRPVRPLGRPEAAPPPTTPVVIAKQGFVEEDLF